MADMVIIGAGLAGLACARHLHRAGRRVVVLDAADAVGGRVRTDVVDGFRLDRGFQVFLESYPEAAAQLDLPALKLQAFQPGALIRFQGRFETLADPWRRPSAALANARSPVGTLADKLRIARLRRRVLLGTLTDQLREPETTTLQMLHDNGFSASIIERFFRPFLGGIFLDRELLTSSRMFRFVFRMFSQGRACLPEAGMQAIPEQLAAGLPAGSVRLGARVASVRPDGVTLATGEPMAATAVVVATDGSAAQALLNETPTAMAWQGVTCLYFAAPVPPLTQPVLVLNGDGRGPINNLCVPTAVAPSYGPPGRSLISVTVLGTLPDDSALRHAVHTQLKQWFGPQVEQWQHLRTDSIPLALPRQVPPALAEPERSVRTHGGVYVCGDHRDNASINGAMVSGRRAAEAILADHSVREYT
jgi:phytoene dehydrogenase-like protein